MIPITRGKILAPTRNVIYGVPGLGKTSFACGCEYPGTTGRPDVLVLDYGRRTNHLDVARTPGGIDWAASLALLREACTGPGDWRTVVVDEADKLEDQAASQLCAEGNGKAKNLRSLADFGWNDGFIALGARWREVLEILQQAQGHGRSVWIVAHITRSKVKDPTLGEYSEWIPASHPLCWGSTRRWADNVLYAHYTQGLVDERAVHTGERLIETVDGSGYQAKNSHQLPPTLPLSWAAYDSALQASLRDPQEIIASIRSLAELGDVAKAEGYITEANGDRGRLVKVEQALKAKKGTGK